MGLSWLTCTWGLARCYFRNDRNAYLLTRSVAIRSTTAIPAASPAPPDHPHEVPSKPPRRVGPGAPPRAFSAPICNPVQDRIPIAAPRQKLSLGSPASDSTAMPVMAVKSVGTVQSNPDKLEKSDTKKKLSVGSIFRFVDWKKKGRKKGRSVSTENCASATDVS